MRARTAPLALLVAAALAAGCGRSEVEPASGSAAPAPATELALALPTAGETRIERRGELYDVAASEAAPLDALTELSMHAGFRIERGRGPLPSARRTVWLRGVSLERAVAALLAGVPHEVHHEFVDGDPDPARAFEGRAVALARVSVGSVAGAAGARAGHALDEARAGGPPRHPRRRQASGALEDRAAERTPFTAPGDAAAEAVARDAEDPDADVRLDAIDRMEPEGAERPLLERMLRGDPNAEVRAAAAERLSEGNPFEAAPGLLDALADRDPSVVEAAVRGLEDVYDEAPDPRIRERIAALREHRDADVREAVEEFEAWTEE